MCFPCPRQFNAMKTGLEKDANDNSKMVHTKEKLGSQIWSEGTDRLFRPSRGMGYTIKTSPFWGSKLGIRNVSGRVKFYDTAMAV